MFAVAGIGGAVWPNAECTYPQVHVPQVLTSQGPMTSVTFVGQFSRVLCP